MSNIQGFVEGINIRQMSLSWNFFSNLIFPIDHTQIVPCDNNGPTDMNKEFSQMTQLLQWSEWNQTTQLKQLTQMS